MTADREKIVEKIKALMSKTVDKGCTEEEALAALDKARALMDAYEVTEADLQLTKEETAVLRSEPPNSLDPHNIKFHLMGAVAEFCSCQTWQWRKREGKAVTFCGLPSDAQLATWLLDTLATFVQVELANHLMNTLPPRGERRSVIRGFVDGCCERISDRLRALHAQSAAAATSNRRELVVIKSAAIDAKMEEWGIHVSGLCLGGQTDSGSYKAGATAGNRANFGRPVSGRNATLRLK
jgi:Protein of unknown function (DUF2786)